MRPSTPPAAASWRRSAWRPTTSGPAGSWPRPAPGGGHPRAGAARHGRLGARGDAEELHLAQPRRRAGDARGAAPTSSSAWAPGTLNILDHRTGERRPAVPGRHRRGRPRGRRPAQHRLPHVAVHVPWTSTSGWPTCTSSRPCCATAPSPASSSVHSVTDIRGYGRHARGGGRWSRRACGQAPGPSCYINVTHPLRHEHEDLERLVFLAEKGVPSRVRPAGAGAGASSPVTQGGCDGGGQCRRALRVGARPAGERGLSRGAWPAARPTSSTCAA